MKTFKKRYLVQKLPEKNTWNNLWKTIFGFNKFPDTPEEDKELKNRILKHSLGGKGHYRILFNHPRSGLIMNAPEWEGDI